MADTKFQTSFIPKRPLAPETGKKSGMSLFLLLSIIIFLVTIGISGWVFLEKNLLIQEIESQEQTITTNKNGLVSNQTTIQDLIELDSRINVGQQLLASHVAVSPLFSFLEQATLQNVRFTSFDFSSTAVGANGSAQPQITLNGEANSFETVASQADEFENAEWTNIIQDPEISNLVLNTDGSVSFTFTANVVPSFLLYANNEAAEMTGGSGSSTVATSS